VRISNVMGAATFAVMTRPLGR